MPSIQLPEYGKHVVFLGATGSGKSFLAQTMLRHYRRYFAIDTQDSLDLEGKIVRDPRKLPFALRFYDRIHYVPKEEFLERGTWNYVFSRILNSSTKKKPSPRVIYIDEIYHVGYGASFPTWLPRAMTTARQRKLSLWIATQRPRQIPVPVLSEASKIYVFYLNREDDMKYVAGLARRDKTGFLKVLEEQEDDYSFIEIDARKGTWAKFPKIGG